MPASRKSEIRSRGKRKSRIDRKTEVVTDIVGVQMTVDGSINDVKPIPSHKDDAKQLKIVAVRFLIGL